ncbi:hypothetical protein [Amycolatopsis sp. NPDC059021]|uniref:hypothetical protein n=1 Tax=Amycolatopsis sp. NPDC059021 TaxID=3346704 RepID=UPI003670A5E2
MPPAPRSLRQEQRELAARMRADHKTWVEIAASFRTRYNVNIRVALRMAHDWSQRAAADQWNNRWPADRKTFKNFSYWEIWPAPTGYEPSLEVLGKLAELYECSVADLVSDCADFRSADLAYANNRRLSQISNIAKTSTTEPEGNEIASLQELISRLEIIDVHELARLTTTWSEQLGAVASRRSLLLKLSAGLSLAAASPALSDDIETDSTRLTDASDSGFSGIWHSRYSYPSSGRGVDFTSEHYVIARQHGNKIIGQSLPHSTGSQLRLELAVDAHVATGTWRETTSSTGYYKGATYHGTLQMIIDPSGRRMRGMWLGFGRDFAINSGQWHLTWEERSTSKNMLRAYHEKL